MAKRESKGFYPHYGSIQRYPHTTYHAQDPFWIYEELGILKNWLATVTELGTYLAEQETDDCDNIIKELKAIANKLQDWIADLTNYLNSLYTAISNENSYLVNWADDLYGFMNQMSSWANKLSNISKLFENLHQNFLAINNALDDSKNEISNIYEEIDNIYNYLEGSYVDHYTRLTEGTDYDITYCNGFAPMEGCSPYVRYQKVKFGESIYHQVNFWAGSESDGTGITIPYSYTSANYNNEEMFSFRHAHSWRDWSQSWICVIQFKGDYAFLNDIQHITYENGGNTANIWNGLPRSARACWDVNLAAGFVDNISSDGRYSFGNGLNINAVNIADGLNGNYWTYITEGLADEIYFYNLNCNITAIGKEA